MAVIGLMCTVLREDAIFVVKKKKRIAFFFFHLRGSRFLFIFLFSLEISSILLLLIEHITVRFFFSLLLFSFVDSSDFELVYDCYFLEIVAINNVGFVST